MPVNILGREYMPILCIPFHNKVFIPILKQIHLIQMFVMVSVVVRWCQGVLYSGKGSQMGWGVLFDVRECQTHTDPICHLLSQLGTH